MVKLAILSDDFTGALDTAVQFSVQGVQALVFSYVPEELPECTVLAVCLDARHLSPRDAYDRYAAAALTLKRLGVPRLYLKTDSGMRGNPGAAFEAAMRVWDASVYFVPAYPRMGRTVRQGRLLVGGAPVSQSIYGRDLLNPVRQDSIADILAQQTAFPITRQWEEQGVILLQDAETEEELHQAALNLRSLPNTRLLAGCAGFARYLPMVLALPAGPAPEVVPAQPLLVISGSASRVSKEQLQYCMARGFRPVPFGDVLEEQPDFLGIAQAVLRESRKNHVMLDLSSGTPLDDRAPGLTAEQVSRRITANLGKAVAATIRAGFCGGLFVIGGDTLSQVLTALKARSVRPLAEPEPGIVAAQVLLEGKTLFMLAKSGSFGSPQAVERICRAWNRT